MNNIIRSNGRKYTLKENNNRFLFPEEYQKLEDQLKKKQKHSIRFLINTGARINEAKHVEVQDCDLERKRIVLRVTKTKAKKKEKKGRIRIIPISTQYAKQLNQYIKKTGLQGTDRIGILSNAALNQAYKKAGIKAGIKDYQNISSHTLRKTLEVWLLALGIDSLAITAHIGHDLKTAAQYYVSPDIFSWEDKQKMREIIGDLYRR